MRSILTIAAIAAPLEVGRDSGSPPTPGAPDTQRPSVAATNTTATTTPVPRLATRPYEGAAA